MGRGKRTSTDPKTPARPLRASERSLDGYLLHTPRPAACSPAAPKMADAASSTSGPDPTAAIARLELRLESILAGMPTKTDLADMLSDLHASVHRDVEEVRGEVTELGSRVSRLERAAEEAPPLAPANPEAYSELRRLVDDVDNRGRRNNLRVRGLKELDPPEQLEEVLCRFFNSVLGRDPTSAIELQRAHRALRPKPQDGDPPRDVVCCFASYRLKEQIVKHSRNARTWDFEGQSLELYQDLTPFTLAARRHLRPITQALTLRHIPYRWGFPLALTVRMDGATHSILRPRDVPDFVAALRLPSVDVQDWEQRESRRPGGPARSQHMLQRRGAEEAHAGPDRDNPDEAV
uniref:Uncharacterized protein n=1 Tax=Leptobrachium leishanense TaxID=445787 RepID=A0A8C5Q7H7_9ANUR